MVEVEVLPTMKRLLIISVTLLLLLAACGKEPEMATLANPVPDQEMTASKDGLSLTLDEDYFAGSPAVIKTVVTNNSSADYRLGEFYHIEVMKDNQWYIITYSDTVFLKNPAFKDFGSVLIAGGEAHQEFSVDALGVTLIPGNYRLVKTFLAKDEPMHEQSVAVPFTVE